MAPFKRADPFPDSGQFTKTPKNPKPAIDPDEIPKAARSIEADEQRRAGERLTHRQETVGHPGKLEAADAETWASRRIAELDVDAVVELEYALKFGSEGARERARDKILDANGHGKRDKSGVAANLIVINMGPGGTPPPLPYVGAVVDAAVKSVEAPKLPAPHA